MREEKLKLSPNWDRIVKDLWQVVTKVVVMSTHVSNQKVTWWLSQTLWIDPTQLGLIRAQTYYLSLLKTHYTAHNRPSESKTN